MADRLRARLSPGRKIFLLVMYRRMFSSLLIAYTKNFFVVFTHGFWWDSHLFYNSKLVATAAEDDNTKLILTTSLLHGTGSAILGGRGGHSPPTFLCSKKKKGKQKEKRRTFKAETIKRLSPRSKCYCFSHCRVSRSQNFFWSANHGSRQYLSVFHGPSTLKSIMPALW